MPSGKSSSKRSHQPLFSEAIAQPKSIARQPALSGHVTSPADPRAVDTTDQILLEIIVVGMRFEAKDLKILHLSSVPASIRTDIACFRKKVTDLDQWLMTVEDHISTLPEHDAELWFLRAKITDLEDRSRRDNVHFFGIPECKEGSDIKVFLKSFFPELTGLDFSPPLKFQRVHRIGSLHKATPGRPHPIIACFLRHDQDHLVISTVRSQGPYSLEGHEVRVAADFSKMTNERPELSPLRNFVTHGSRYTQYP
ncbi:hypothetical protein NDU88_010185 [Pleurodeles waltl]|uniref:Uncharacterized protein n=1 Tax=Pleurodeles waltl TaxID=8319 RepID=A0AAV7QZJ2_PLEWA|nr:hypothetical protein NDU88_010185 [Pleurodeles waltl]